MKPLELWGGIECTVNRVGDTWFNQLQRNGHSSRIADLDLIAGLGIRTLRYPQLWELTCPASPCQFDWRWADSRLGRLRALGITPVVGLIHHGSGPSYTSLTDSGFASGLARYARAVAERFPWVKWYTPVNEPLTTARFSGLYGLWYPHGRDDRTFARALLNQCRATVLCMQAVRQVTPDAKLLQTEDFGKTFSTPAMRYQADFDNERRWLSWDLLCGRVDRAHPLRPFLLSSGASEDELEWFAENACPPDLLGVNHYLTSDRYLDERCERYPREFVGSNGRDRYADLDAVRIAGEGGASWLGVLRDVWRRYELPIAITEVHLGCTREEQLRWLHEAWKAAQEARNSGADVRAVTAWALLGSFDWNSLLTRVSGHYESGAFDIRGPAPRATAIASFVRELTKRGAGSHPVLPSEGWWRRPARLLYEGADPVPQEEKRPDPVRHEKARPLLICGGRGALATAFARACEVRGLEARVCSRAELDICDSGAIEAAIANLHPWAIINAAGYTRVDEAEYETAGCQRENTLGARSLAEAASRDNLQLLTFSSDLVFDGLATSPYVESSAVAPVCAYGRSKALAEVDVMNHCAQTLCVRTAAFFGANQPRDFLTCVLRRLAGGQGFAAPNDIVISPTYLPDLVHASLDLLIDRASGVWHLTNQGAVSWADFVRRAAEIMSVDTSRLVALPLSSCGRTAGRARFSALASERGAMVAPLEDALHRYAAAMGYTIAPHDSPD
jgi:dTDP-4-dehydrorhamnose reductase